MADYAGHYSEFQTLVVNPTDAIPLDLGGACQVAFTAMDGDIVFSRERTIPDDQAFLLPSANAVDAVGNQYGSTPFVLPISDERLWVRGFTGAATLYVWIVRRSLA
jgi:hypothetical protein